ncbi:hypothetical protein E2L08_05565 [Palleronia sediminis]|uniref:Thiol:disulfide interchange protein DsbD N-terminal domain-containing protein n=1 Tax=Palleronia sediminis TaxID=2547833 RepID=A0A4R6AEL8_9RHOB|nr:protein-disulfide reductase DsbD domain-containing protein [Palleronia sediminis]TDL81585.1 hypothetical protein E2L08_05565 [Palleronia sediminis]
MFRTALLLVCLALPATAQEADVRLLPGWRMENGNHMAALEIRLDQGWKTYWRAPGEAGIPPRLDWRGSDNLAAAQIHWPAPMAFRQSGFTTIGYEDAVILPIEIAPTRAGAPIEVDLSMEFGICEEICVPVTVELDGSLPPETVRADARIRAALARRPLDRADGGVGRVACEVTPSGRGGRLTATVEMPPQGGVEVAAIEAGDPGLRVGRTQTARQGDTLIATAEILPPRGQPLALDRGAITLTVLGTNGAVQIDGCR